jgi:hypothetical protein
MKKTILAAVIGLMAASSFAAGSAGAAGPTFVNSQVSGSVLSVNGGSSQSGASNQQTASVTATATNVTANSVNTATSAGSGYTTSTGYAYNLSTGNASGSASSAGHAVQDSVGGESNNYAGVGSGYEVSGSTDSIQAGTNQGAAFVSNTSGDFSSQVATGFSGSGTPTRSTTATANTTGNGYANTVNFNGVYLDGNNVEFGGDSNPVSAGDINNVGSATFSAQAVNGSSVSISTPQTGE